MFLQTDIEIAIVAWLKSAISPSVITFWEHQNIPRPTSQYISLHAFTTQGTGFDTNTQIDPVTGKVQVIGNRELSLHMQVIGGTTCLDVAEQIKNSLELPSIQLQLRVAGLAIKDIKPIMDISTVVDNRWEERNAIDVVFRYGEKTLDNGTSYFDHSSTQ